MQYLNFRKHLKHLGLHRAQEETNNVSTGLVVDKDGNTYITGYFSDTVHFGSYELVCKGMSDVFVAKVDKDGNYLWAISAGGSRQDIPNDIAVDDTGNLYIIGSYALIANFGTESLISSNFSNIFIAKIDKNGNFIWTKHAGGAQDDIGNGIALDLNGNIYVTGSFRLIADFGNLQLNVQDNVLGGSNQYDNIFVGKLDNGGNFKWVVQAGGDGRDYGVSLDVNDNGDIFVAGIIANDSWFDEGGAIFLSNTSGNQNSFIAKYNSRGTCQWVRGFTSDDENRVYHIAADKQGNAFVSGRFSGKTTFTNIEETAIGTHDAYLVKYNQTGAIVWYQLLTGKGETHCTKV